jgi:hypothetical protein
MSSIFGSAKATQESDNIIILQTRMKRAAMYSPKLQKFLQICKNRYDGELGYIDLDFNKDTLSFKASLAKEDYGRTSGDNDTFYSLKSSYRTWQPRNVTSWTMNSAKNTKNVYNKLANRDFFNDYELDTKTGKFVKKAAKYLPNKS